MRGNLKDIIPKINHHYSSKHSAISALRKIIKRKDLPGIRLENSKFNTDIILIEPSETEKLILKYNINTKTTTLTP